MVTSMVRCMILLILSSILLVAKAVFFSISRRIVILEAAKGIRTVLMQVSIKCTMAIAGCRVSRYERSGSFLLFSWVAAASFALDNVSSGLIRVLWVMNNLRI